MLASADAYGLTFLYPAGDTGVGAFLRDHGEFARPEIDLICDLLHPFGNDATFIDVGANIGAIALPVARRAGCRVLAFEANGPIYKLLARNVTANGLPNVEPYLAAVEDADGVTEFPFTARLTGKYNYGAIGRDLAARVARRRVRRCRLDSVAPPTTRMIKIDVEGTETAVLRGARRIVRDLRPILLIEVRLHPSPETERIIRSLAAVGYRMMWFLSPFATPMAPRNPQEFVTFDRMILALPTIIPVPGWNLPQIDPADPWRNADWLHHLARYGLKKFTLKPGAGPP